MDSAELTIQFRRLARPAVLALALAAALGCAHPALPPVDSAAVWPVRALVIEGEEPLRSQELLGLEIVNPRPAAPGEAHVTLRDLPGSGRSIDAETLRAIVRAIARDYAQRGEREVHADILRSDLDALLRPGSSGTLVVRIRRSAVARSSAR